MKRTVLSTDLFVSTGTVVGFVPPGSTSTIFSSVELVSSINLKGDITGSYPDANNLVHGFLRHSNGTFVIFDVPGSTTTNAFSINDAGAITGNYLAADGRYRGFLHDPEGNFTSFDPGFYTLSAGINEDGAIAGYYSNGGLPIPSVNVRGFVRSPQGTITTFDPNDVEPTLCPLLSGIGTTQVFPTSIREGVITGYCFGSQGWVRHP